MVLDKTSVWYLPTFDGFRPGVKIAEDCPDYIVDWYKENKPNIELTETELNPEDTINWPIKPERWPKPEELSTKRYALLYGRFHPMTRINSYEETTELKFGSFWFPPEKKETDKEVPKYVNGEVVHFMKLYGYDKEKSNYRRFKLSKYLQDKLGDKYYPITDIREMAEEGKFEYAIVSCSVGWEVIKAFDYDYLIYDRTDNWSDWSESHYKEEQKLLELADIVFTSSKWLYEDSLKRTKAKVIYIPNGCDVKEYVPVKLHKETTGCYIGKTDNKVDWNCIKVIADKYKIKVYGDIVEQFKHPNVEWCGFLPEDELHTEISKCAFGLIPFKEGDWTAAMLPLKLFHYANAHIPTVFKNCPECRNYSSVAFEMDDDNNFTLTPVLDEEYEEVLKQSNWKEKFDEMWNWIHIKGTNKC